MGTRKKTSDGVKILHRHYIKNDEARKAALEEERVNARVARMIYDLRVSAGLNQSELAEKVGTTQSVISRLEDADYKGHSLSMLARIADKLHHKLKLVAVPEAPDAEKIPQVFRMVMIYLRRAKGLTVDKFAKQLEVDRSEIQAMEQSLDYRPSITMIEKLSDFYQIPQERLNALTGLTPTIPDDLCKEALRFTVKSESFTTLAEEEKKSLDEFMRFLKAAD